jgi:hypothetical protein
MSNDAYGKLRELITKEKDLLLREKLEHPFALTAMAYGQRKLEFGWMLLARIDIVALNLKRLELEL